MDLGENAAFTVGAGCATAVQWEVSTDGGLTFAAIAGANGTVLSIPDVTLAEDGNEYEVVLTLGSGAHSSTVTEGPALLTVLDVTPPTPPASASAISPSIGALTGGVTVTVTGTGFASGDTVQFGDSAGTDVQVISPTRLTVIAPASPTGGPGAFNVGVANAAGDSALTPGDVYTYDVVPVVRWLLPASGPAGGGTKVLIGGSGFASGATVSFGAVLSPTVKVIGADFIEAVSPPHTPGSVAVTVADPDGATSLTGGSDLFSYKNL